MKERREGGRGRGVLLSSGQVIQGAEGGRWKFTYLRVDALWGSGSGEGDLAV